MKAIKLFPLTSSLSWVGGNLVRVPMCSHLHEISATTPCNLGAQAFPTYVSFSVAFSKNLFGSRRGRRSTLYFLKNICASALLSISSDFSSDVIRVLDVSHLENTLRLAFHLGFELGNLCKGTLAPRAGRYSTQNISQWNGHRLVYF